MPIGGLVTYAESLDDAFARIRRSLDHYMLEDLSREKEITEELKSGNVKLVEERAALLAERSSILSRVHYTNGALGSMRNNIDKMLRSDALNPAYTPPFR